MSAAEPEPGASSGRPLPSSPPLVAAGERLPWLLRQPQRDADVRPADRETDRAAALDARRTALVVVPAVALGWVAVAVLAGEEALQLATLAALVVCVAIGARAAVTTKRFRRRWLDPASLVAPPAWVTLATVGAAVAAVVAASNVGADLQSDRSAVRAIVVSAIALAVVGGGAFVHLAGGRSVGAALRDPAPRGDAAEPDSSSPDV